MFKYKLLKITYGTNGQLINQVTHHISNMYIGGDESRVSLCFVVRDLFSLNQLFKYSDDFIVVKCNM